MFKTVKIGKVRPGVSWYTYTSLHIVAVW